MVSPVNSRGDFIALIRSTTATLELETEEMQDSAIETELIQAARRGVPPEGLSRGVEQTRNGEKA